MGNRIKLGIFSLLMIAVLLHSPPVGGNHADGISADLELNDSGIYNVELIASNFEYQLVDLVRYERLISEGYNQTEARLNASHYEVVSNLDPGRPINITAKSSQGIHGIYIQELNIDLYLEKPADNATYGPVVTASGILPSVDTTIRIYCNVFCGSGHSEMDIELRVGEGRDFSDGSIDILSDWRVWAMFGTFFVVTAGIVGIAVMKPRFFFSWDEESTDD